MYKSFVNHVQVESELSKTVLLKAFYEDGMCVSCKETGTGTKGVDCRCAIHANDYKNLLVKNLLPAHATKRGEITRQVLSIFLPTCLESMANCISEKNALTVEDGEAEWNISPLKDISTSMGYAMGVRLNGDLVFVSVFGSYTECAEMIATYMGSY